MLPQIILPGNSYSCGFTVSKGVDAVGTETDEVTASGTDDEDNPVSDSDDATVSFIPPIVVTDSALCTFDVDAEAAGRQFRLLFTQDPQYMPNYKLTSSNPGQFFFNGIAYGGPGQTITFPVTVPYAFASQGAKPVHVYSTVDVTVMPGGFCFDLENATTLATVDAVTADIRLADYTVGYVSGIPETQTEMLTITFPDGSYAPGFFYVNFHLDYDLKGPQADGPDPNLDPDRYGKDAGDNALAPGTSTVLIPELAPHEFCIDPDGTGGTFGELCDTVYNDNEFKKNPGVAGVVAELPSGCTEISCGTAVPGARVELVAPSGTVVGSAETNADGWYQIVYKHTGKPALYTVNLYSPSSAVTPTKSQPVTLKGNGFVEVSFTLP
jgi:hypothetical protein